MMQRSRLLKVACAITINLCVSSLTQAALVTFAYEGTVNQVNLSAGLDNLTFQAFLGETMRMEYTFESTSVDSNPNVAVGEYDFISARLTLGSNDYVNGLSSNELTVGDGLSDLYNLVVDNALGPDTGGISPFSFAFVFSGGAPSVFSSDVLPLTQPNPDDFTTTIISLAFLDISTARSAQLRATNVQISAIPIPAAIWLLASGLTAMMGFTRLD